MRRGITDWIGRLGAALMLFAPAPALAQAVGELAPPPVRQTIDENGVDVIRGSYAPSAKTWLSIGPGNTHGLALERIGGLGGLSSLTSAISVSGGVTIVNLGTQSDSFTQSGGTYVSTQGSGATLVALGTGQYIYTGRDGTQATFASATGGPNPPQFGEIARLATVGFPDGSTLTVHTKVQTYCAAL